MNLQEEVKFTFDVAKCDRIFDELLKAGKIKITHIIPPLEELTRHDYCKFHNSYSHATNDCNVFCWQVQSSINEDRLDFHAKQVDHNPFAMNTLELNNPKVLIRPDEVEKPKGKNVIIGEQRSEMKVQDKDIYPQGCSEGFNARGARQDEEDRQHVDRSPVPPRDVPSSRKRLTRPSRSYWQSTKRKEQAKSKRVVQVKVKIQNFHQNKIKIYLILANLKKIKLLHLIHMLDRPHRGPGHILVIIHL
jgi:hypothetical protein